MSIYFAAPLFSEAERQFNLHLTEQIEKLGFTVFLPQRDGVESSKDEYKDLSKDEKRRILFQTDRDRIFAADIFLFVLDGRVPDEGACVELGLAYAHRELTKKQKVLIGLMTDKRAAFLGGKLNPMLKIPLDSILETQEDLLKLLTKFVPVV